MDAQKRKRVVIVGGGFAGLNAANILGKKGVEVLLIDKTNHHLFQPLLYQVASAALSPGEIAVPIREVVRKHPHTSVVMGEVVSIDKTKNEITLKDGEKISFDFLIVGVGARHSYFGNNHWEQFAPGLKTISDAVDLREKILLSFEKAERATNAAEAAKHLNFVIIGGGPTGVEMAGAIAEIAHHTMLKNFRRISPEKSQIFLIELLPHILPMYPQSLAIHAENDLKKMGVRVLTGRRVVDVNANGVQVDDEFFPSTNVIWAAGNQASPLLQTLEIPLDRQGRAIVGPDLSIPGHPNIFVVGDAAHAKDKKQLPLPGVASVAIQQGRYLGKLLSNGAALAKRRPFSYRDKGSMATIGRAKAIAQVGKLQFSGFLAWFAWCFIHIVYLIGFRNRVGVMIEWFFFYLTGQRGARLIYRSLNKEK